MIKLNKLYVKKKLYQTLNYALVLKKVHKFNPSAWLKPYIDMNTDLK